MCGFLGILGMQTALHEGGSEKSSPLRPFPLPSDGRSGRASTLAEFWAARSGNHGKVGQRENNQDEVAERVGYSPSHFEHIPMFPAICAGTARILAISTPSPISAASGQTTKALSLPTGIFAWDHPYIAGQFLTACESRRIAQEYL